MNGKRDTSIRALGAALKSAKIAEDSLDREGDKMSAVTMAGAAETAEAILDSLRPKRRRGVGSLPTAALPRSLDMARDCAKSAVTHLNANGHTAEAKVMESVVTDIEEIRKLHP